MQPLSERRLHNITFVASLYRMVAPLRHGCIAVASHVRLPLLLQHTCTLWPHHFTTGDSAYAVVRVTTADSAYAVVRSSCTCACLLDATSLSVKSSLYVLANSKDLRAVPVLMLRSKADAQFRFGCAYRQGRRDITGQTSCSFFFQRLLKIAGLTTNFFRVASPPTCHLLSLTSFGIIQLLALCPLKIIIYIIYVKIRLQI
jgi:hypothetical protein